MSGGTTTAKALGNVTFTVLTVAVPGAGEAGAVGKAGELAEVSGDAAKASKLATAADVAKTGVQTFTKLTDPFHYAAQLPKVADFATGLDLTALPVLTKFGGADRSGLTNASKTFTAADGYVTVAGHHIPRASYKATYAASVHTTQTSNASCSALHP